MQIVSIFSRALKTSRKYAFENIMDLDHVCHLHARWFSNLRIRQWSREHVDYRLTSHFYGLTQEIDVKGEPIDENSYWYEFNGPIARIRVDGSIEGPDGDIVLTEKITYRFAWFFAPFFWILQPLFKKQKDDILLEDSRLLERMFDLEQKGFQRDEVTQPRIVVYGGNGFFGRLVVEDLLKHTNAQIVIASRSAKPVDFGASNRVLFFESNIDDYDSVASTIGGANAVICCTGPFQGQSLTLLKACIDKKVHYIDVADDRNYVMQCHELQNEIESAGIMAFVGCSVVPGITSLLTRFSQNKVGKIEETHICITPGTKHPRGVGSFLCLLDTVNERYEVDKHSEPRAVVGWTEREAVSFPEPIGRRWVYSVVDIADYFTQPLYFSTRKTVFKIGAELDFLNKCLSFTRWAKQTFKVSNLNWFVPFARPFILLSSAFGTTKGGVMVTTKQSNSKVETKQWCVYKEERGEIIPAFLPALAAEMVLSNELKSSGLIDLSNWLSLERFSSELAKRDIKLVSRIQGASNWELLN